MTRFGVLGSYGGLNSGDEAICAGVISSILNRVPEALIVLFSRDVAHSCEHHHVDAVYPSREVSRDDLAPVLSDLDVLLVGGGGLFYDGEAQAYTYLVRLAQRLGVTTAAYAVGAGPLDDPSERAAVAETFDQMAAITVRDDVSKRTLEAAGVTRPMQVTADPALLVRAPRTGKATARADEPFALEGIDTTQRLVGMSVREAGNAAPDISLEHHHALLASAADFLVHRVDATVVFVPMERSDIAHAHAVMADMNAPEHARVLSGSHTPERLLQMISHFDFAVGMRLHFLIFAAVARVPFLPLAYAAKVSDFVRNLDMPLPPSAERAHAGTLLAAIDRAWDMRRVLKTRLDETVPPLERRAEKTIDIILAAVRTAGGAGA